MTLAIPGQRLGPTTSYTSGPGTHIHESSVYASITGTVQIEKSKTTPKSTVSVARGPVPSPSTSETPATKKYNTLPSVDSTVLARVTRVQKRQVTVSILIVEPPASSKTSNTTSNLSDSELAALLSTATNPENHSNSDDLRFPAIIRREDVRAVEKDRVVLDEMFRVGDVVRGTVISMGDQSFYYLSTARNDLGVVMARSASGNMMFPVSWREMRDPVTGLAEERKVARPF
ncbi:hypothetical protein ASPZODRAFT_127092 [Penicilliopsis zonata CBS 506.65]|uniref:Exosome complex component CSL4 C-terminal domain-containing protein n=1 Tax=Penicilliopsis zonata CBS 506.65 TaxID=1073090 RepID=A0A1L9SVE1_9EURO|nr:hypothetical protein ASPZODRAFT_127092 [Penicilliopsis zonata CBS 506.65]OJJ51084.1 hypothetical protein ASPZODRAFT_127092 [Penicilliopsis zonata CBS 506.65]